MLRLLVILAVLLMAGCATAKHEPSLEELLAASLHDMPMRPHKAYCDEFMNRLSFTFPSDEPCI